MEVPHDDLTLSSDPNQTQNNKSHVWMTLPSKDCKACEEIVGDDEDKVNKSAEELKEPGHSPGSVSMSVKNYSDVLG
jgi:hypothetical protein